MRFAKVLGVETAELLRKLKQVEDNAWMLFSELPPCVARTRALHVYLDARELAAKMADGQMADGQFRTTSEIFSAPATE
jgi:hypothetical protein